MGRAILWNKVPFAEESILISETMILVHVCIVMIPPVSKSAVQATYKNEEGVVLVDYERCIGCRFCTVACCIPGALLQLVHARMAEALKVILIRPRVARPKGVVKNAPCVQRLQRASEAEGRSFNKITSAL